MKKNKFLLLSTFVVGFAAAPSTPSAQETQPLFYNTRGGESYDSAVLPPLSQDLKLNHHQRRGAYDYFMVDLKAGQAIKASLSVGEKGVEIRPDNTALETGYPYAGLVVYDAGGNQLGYLDFSGSEKNLQKTLEVDASTPQRIYLLLGSGAQAMHKDYVGFRVDVQNNFDADGEGEAGPTLETALELDPPPGSRKTYRKNFLTRNDEADFYKIRTKPGVSLALEIEPENPRTTVSAALYDELRMELARERSATPGGVVNLSSKANTSVTYLKVTRELGDEPTAYEMRLLPPPPETAPAAETRPSRPETIPSVLPKSPPSDAAKADSKADKDRPRDRDKKPAKKVAWWKSPKMMLWGGAAAVGVLALLLGGLVLLRRTKAGKSASNPP